MPPPKSTRNCLDKPLPVKSAERRRVSGIETWVTLTCCFLNEQRYSSVVVTSRIMGMGALPSANRDHRKYTCRRRRRGHPRGRFHHAGVERLSVHGGK